MSDATTPVDVGPPFPGVSGTTTAVLATATGEAFGKGGEVRPAERRAQSRRHRKARAAAAAAGVSGGTPSGTAVEKPVPTTPSTATVGALATRADADATKARKKKARKVKSTVATLVSEHPWVEEVDGRLFSVPAVAGGEEGGGGDGEGTAAPPPATRDPDSNPKLLKFVRELTTATDVVRLNALAARIRYPVTRL